MRMLSPILCVYLFTLAAYSVQAKELRLTLKDRGKRVRVLKLKELKQLVTPVTIEVYEPHENKRIKYEGFPTLELIKKIYRKIPKEEVLFTCADGFQPSIPAEQFQKYTSYLVYRKRNKAKFSFSKEGGEEVPLGPFYLIWDNIKYPELIEQKTSYWPYQVTTMDLIRFADKFPNLSPPRRSSKKVKKGFLIFRRHCLTCHTINGEGGKKAIELNYPANVTEYIKEKWLRRWIANPKKIRYNATMPAYEPDSGTKKEGIDAILAYLKAMAKQKRKPKGS